MNRDGYRDQIVTCDVGVSLHAFQDTSTVYEVQQGHKHTVLCIALSKLISCAFSTIPICPFLIQRIFHSLVYICIKAHVKFNIAIRLINRLRELIFRAIEVAYDIYL